MLKILEGKIKEIFSGDGIVDDLLTEKGVRMIIDKIPEDIIAMLARMEYSEWVFNIVGVIINGLLPAEHKLRGQDIIKSVVSALDTRVDAYRMQNGIVKPHDLREKVLSTSTDSTTKSDSAGPSNAELVGDLRRLILHPRLKNKKAGRLAALNAIYERVSTKGDKRYFGVNKADYRAKVDEVLAQLSEDEFLALLDDNPRNRKLFIDSAVGTLNSVKPSTTAKETATKLMKGLEDICDATSLSAGKAVVDRRIREHEKEMARNKTGWRRWL